MWEEISEFFTDWEFWKIIIKILITTLLSALVGLVGTLIGKIISKSKQSKVYKYAKTCVAAAEQKFPNEGKKMGPEKMSYVMDQMAIKFPKIKENTYFYNIAEAAVLELNRDMQREKAIEEFKEKYGEDPLDSDKDLISPPSLKEENGQEEDVKDSNNSSNIDVDNNSDSGEEIEDESISTTITTTIVEEKTTTNVTTTTQKRNKLTSF